MKFLEREGQGAMGVEGPERSSGERSETERSGGTETPIARESTAGGPLDSEVSDRPIRRHFSLEYKLSILKKADGCTQPGQLGELLRREGLYSSTFSLWRRQRQQGMLNALRPAKRGRKATAPNPLSQRVAELERENKDLKRKLQRAETIIEVQKKLSEVLGIPLKNPEVSEND